MISQYIPLKEVIFMYSEAAKQSDAEYLRLWRMSYRGFIQMGLNNFWLPKTVPVPVNDNKTVSYPDDYVQWLKVGYAADDGGIVTLKKNNRMLTTEQVYSGTAEYVSSNLYFNNGSVAYSSVIREGEFKEDKANRCFLLSANTDLTEVILEYISSPEEDPDYQIPIQFLEAMIDWLSWQDIKHIPAQSHFGRGDKQDRAYAFRASVKLAQRMYKPFRIQDYLAATNYRSAISTLGGTQRVIENENSYLLINNSDYLLINSTDKIIL